jgi:hypothetical protein
MRDFVPVRTFWGRGGGITGGGSRRYVTAVRRKRSGILRFALNHKEKRGGGARLNKHSGERAGGGFGGAVTRLVHCKNCRLLCSRLFGGF